MSIDNKALKIADFIEDQNLPYRLGRVVHLVIASRVISLPEQLGSLQEARTYLDAEINRLEGVQAAVVATREARETVHDEVFKSNVDLFIQELTDPNLRVTKKPRRIVFEDVVEAASRNLSEHVLCTACDYRVHYTVIPRHMKRKHKDAIGYYDPKLGGNLVT